MLDSGFCQQLGLSPPSLSKAKTSCTRARDRHRPCRHVLPGVLASAPVENRNLPPTLASWKSPPCMGLFSQSWLLPSSGNRDMPLWLGLKRPWSHGSSYRGEYHTYFSKTNTDSPMYIRATGGNLYIKTCVHMTVAKSCDKVVSKRCSGLASGYHKCEVLSLDPNVSLKAGCGGLYL